MKKKKDNKSVSVLKIIYKWFQLSVDEAMTILVWVLAWSIVEPYVKHFTINNRLLIILLLIILLQRDITKLLKKKK